MDIDMSEPFELAKIDTLCCCFHLWSRSQKVL